MHEDRIEGALGRIEAAMERIAAARDAALAGGAMGASISGAGPSVFAWFEQRNAALAAQAAVQQAFAEAGFDSQAWVSPLNAPAARLL